MSDRCEIVTMDQLHEATIVGVNLAMGDIQAEGPALDPTLSGFFPVEP